MRSRARMWAAGLAVAGALGTGGVAQADTIVNTKTDDPGANCPQTCTLRAAVAAAPAGSTITFADPGTYTLSQGAPIVVGHALTIAGAGADATTIDGSANVDAKQNPHRIFTAQAPLQLSGMTLTGGNAAGDDTCPSACSTIGLNGGGAIFSTVTLSLDRVRLAGNRASLGGAVSSNGTLAMTDVEFSDDDAALAGGLFVRGGTASGTGVSFHDLGAGAYDGGAVLLYHGSLSLTNTTVADSGMASGHAGGIENFGGTLTLDDDTLSGNVRGALMTVQGATTEVGSTIIGAGWPDGDDWACLPAGRPTAVADGVRSGAAITKDDGGNLDEDGHCGLSTTDDRSGDAHLAPLADNGGPTPTMALLHGSAALDALALCDAVDQRGTPRPQNGLCDIGAFEAERTGTPPTATTEAATDLAPYSARLHATVDLGGESGGVHFEWGTSADVVAGGHGTATAEAAAGRASAAALTLDGLQPGRTYSFRAIADNASAASAPGATLSFTTPPGPPVVSDVAVDDQTDTTGELSFTIDPDGADTSYVVRYGTDALTESTSPVDIGAQPGPQRLTTTLADLRPDTRYYFEVVATSSEAPDGVTGNGQFDTERQVVARPGGLLAAQDDGDGCPRATIDWGDGSRAAPGDVQCDDGGEFGQTYALRATHEYAQPGHYPILIDYGSAGTVREWAVISGDPQHVLRVTVSGPGSVFGSGIECPDQCATSADVGTQADLTVEPDDGATFLGWSGDCGGNDCSVTLDGDRAVTARFAGPPLLSDGVGIEPVTDTTAKLHFTIDPNGSDTTYVIRYGTDETYGQSTAPVDLGADPGAQSLSPELTGLEPDTTYHFVVEASNGASAAKVSSGDEQFTTEPQVSALAGRSVTVHDTGFSDTSDCPAATVDWGDDSTSAGDVSCIERPTGGQDYTLTASHTYAAAGHYPIQIAYDRGGGAAALWALISAPQQATPTPTPSATASPTPTPTPTATPTPNPAPVFHQQVVVRPVSGTVLVRRKGTNTFVPLDAKAGIPLGSQVDVTHGRIQLTSVPRRGGKPQSAQFYAGIFTVTQPGAITQLTLSGPKPTCAKPKGRAASAAAKKKQVKSRKLWGNGHGSFRTSGRYSAATVRGTQWLVQDTCAGTLTRVAHGLVAVNDRVRHKTLLVRGGTSYLARPHR